jgi:pimeloyl-ACP methyl ester carboxylesterase
MQIKIANGFLEYEKLGKGIPLLFIHGYPLSRKIWKPQLDGLSDLALSISVDLRGHGDSFAFEGPYSMDTLASDCKRLLDDLTIKSPVVVCGLSMGGYISLAFYRAYPEIFKGMILTSTRSGPDSAEAKANRDASIKNALEFGAIYIADNMLPRLFSPVTLSTNPDLVKTVHEIMVNTSIQGIVGSLEGMKNRLDSTPLLSQISCPVLIIHGADDQLIPQKEAELMDRQIPNSRLIKIAEAGHLPNLEQPDRFNKAVWDFLQSLG